jgi:seryl-tRNA synthetase
MHDLRWIRENPEEFDRGLVRRGLPPRAAEVLALDKEWRAQQTATEELQAVRKRLSRDVGIAKKRGDPVDELLGEIELATGLQSVTAAKAAELRTRIDVLLANLPNLPAPEVPDGPDETANKELRRHGSPPRFNFGPVAHEAIGDKLGLMDFPRAARLSGSRFVVLKGAFARLERAIAQFMLDLHTQEFGYTEIAPPLLVRTGALFGTGQLPKLEEDLYRIADKPFAVGDSGVEESINEQGYYLIPTAEVPLTNLVAGEILDEAALPLRFTAWTPCFRSEAGAAGKDTRGMIRMHQFNKVELVSITRPEDSEAEHERMTSCAEEVLKRLGLAYRVMLLATGDMGFSARKTYDLEVWLPGQDTYREISSCSNCGPFQALRMKARYRHQGAGFMSRLEPVHTLNGSALAVGRTMIAVIENFQRHDGTVMIPEVLRPYMAGQEIIAPHG